MKNDLLDYFEGGRSGVLKRLGDVIRAGLGGLNGIELCALVNHQRIPAGVLPGVAAGDNSKIDRDLIEKVADAFSIDVEKCLKPLPLAETDEADWTALAASAGFLSVGGAEKRKWTKEERLKLFMISKALDALTAAPKK